jgi:hypothetical protein
MDRSQNLSRALPSWFRSPASEIIVLDYNSANPVRNTLNDLGLSDSRLRVVRVEGKTRWHLSDAFNLAIGQVTEGFVLKLDADVVLAQPDLSSLPRDKGTFLTGNWAGFDPTQMYTNGSLFCHVDHLRVVGGWDPRFQTYGWEDSDLYERLLGLGLHRNYFPKGFLHHLDHSDSERLNLSVHHEDSDKLLRANTQANRIASEADFPWKGPVSSLQGADLTEHSEGSIWPQLPSKDRAILCVTALSDELAKRDSETGNTVAKIPLGVKQILRSSIEVIRRKTNQFRPHRPHGMKHIVVRVEHGLGNRLRALASGFQLAQRHGAPLTIAWIPDVHCEARLPDLFHWAGPVVESEEELQELLGSEDFYALDWSVSMSKASESFAELRGGSLYVRSSKSFMMLNDASWRISNRFLQLLVPTEPVQDLMRSFPHDFKVGIHVRQGGGFGFEHLPFEAVENWGPDAHSEIDRHRRSVKTEEFEGILAYLGEVYYGQDPLPVFIAADHIDVKSSLVSAAGSRARFLSSNPETRSTQAIREALAEMYALASAELLCGSTYSAFTEVAHRLALPTQKMVVLGDVNRQGSRS